jgi:polysaccharide export outer membrane protein
MQRLFIFLFYFIPGLVLAQPSIPPGAVEQFNRLSPAQQRAMAQQYGVSIQEIQAATRSATSSSSISELGKAAAPIEPVDKPVIIEKIPERVPEGPPRVASSSTKVPESPPIKMLDEDAIQPALPRYGANIFEESVTTFAPVDNIPVPTGYLLGVGDNLTVVLYGNDNIETQLTIDREGAVNFPLLGPIMLAGLPWSDARELIERRVSDQLIGTNVVVSLGRLRSINVFMAGEVRVPGNYAVSALTTIIQAVYVAGGITNQGSYRDVQVRRQGEIVARLDLYDLLLEGSLVDDERLQSGDVIFVPMAGPIVSIQGEVNRPARFEVLANDRLEELLMMAGGLKPRAIREQAILQRRSADSTLPQLSNLDLSKDDALALPLVDGDVLTVRQLPNRVENPVRLNGAVERPGVFAWEAGLRLSDLIRTPERDLKRSADYDIGLIARRLDHRIDIEVLPFSLQDVVTKPGSPTDPELSPHDEIFVFNLEEVDGSRPAFLASIVARLRRQADEANRAQTVRLMGDIQNTGDYPMWPGQTIADVVTLAGGLEALAPDIDYSSGILVRRDPEDINQISVRFFELGSVIQNPDSRTNLEIKPLDELYIFDRSSSRASELASVVERLEAQADEANRAQTVRLAGDIQNTGKYPLWTGQTISDVVALAGGLKALALDIDYSVGILVRRDPEDINQISVRFFELGDVIQNPGSPTNLTIQPLDELYVFDRSSSRAGKLAGVVRRLEAQATQNKWPQTIQIKGALAGQGTYPLPADNFHVSDFLKLVGGETFFNLTVDLKVGLIVRRTDNLFKVEARPFSLDKALNLPRSENDPLLLPLDEVLIFSDIDAAGESNRQALLAPILTRFEQQATLTDEPQIVTIQGRVREPGRYPILESGDLTYLIDLAGGFAEGAYTESAEIQRRVKTEAQELEVEVIEIELESANPMRITLQSRDALRIKTMPGWFESETVTLSGEVRFPGVYAIEPGELLSSVVTRAGGLTDTAFPEGAIFTNENSKIAQRRQAQNFISQLRRQSANRALTIGEATNSNLLTSLIEEEIDGRVTIDLASIVDGDSSADLVLQGGDSLFVPKTAYTVAVLGEVFQPGTFSFDKRLSANDYLRLAGKGTRYADEKNSYVIKGNGEVIPIRGGPWLFGRVSRRLAPGDVIVVPTNLDYEKAVTRVQSVTSIVFQSMASIAAFFAIKNN